MSFKFIRLAARNLINLAVVLLGFFGSFSVVASFGSLQFSVIVLVGSILLPTLCFDAFVVHNLADPVVIRIILGIVEALLLLDGGSDVIKLFDGEVELAMDLLCEGVVTAKTVIGEQLLRPGQQDRMPYVLSCETIVQNKKENVASMARKIRR